MALEICPNPQNVQHHEWKPMDFGNHGVSLQVTYRYYYTEVVTTVPFWSGDADNGEAMRVWEGKSLHLLNFAVNMKLLLKCLILKDAKNGNQYILKYKWQIN